MAHDPHEPSIPREHPDRRHLAAAAIGFGGGIIVLVLAVLHGLRGDWSTGGIALLLALLSVFFVVLYVAVDQLQSALFKSPVEDLLERSGELIRETDELLREAEAARVARMKDIDREG